MTKHTAIIGWPLSLFTQTYVNTHERAIPNHEQRYSFLNDNGIGVKTNLFAYQIFASFYFCILIL